MGTNLGKLVESKSITISELKGKVLAVDAHNHIFQFITAIRTPQGEYLRTNDGKITSHLLGLFPRTVNQLSQGIRLAYVFDGEVPSLKDKTVKARIERKKDAEERLADAKRKEDDDGIRKYSPRTAHLTPEIIDSSKRLLSAMGIPIVQAPVEADAQTAYMARKEDCFAAASNDYDTLLHGSPRLVRKISKSQRKKSGAEMFFLDEILETLGVTLDELIAIAIMMGTDYHPGGIRGIGPKRGLKLVRQNDIESAFEKAGCNFDWQTLMDLFKDMEVVDDYSVEWKAPEVDTMREFLLEEYEFSEIRVENRIEELNTAYEEHCR